MNDDQFELVMSFARAQKSPFAHWTDKDLFRAIDNPEITEPGDAREAEIQEYVDELRRRDEVRKAEMVRENELREKYRL